jgi:hypothetical protein
MEICLLCRDLTPTVIKDVKVDAGNGHILSIENENSDGKDRNNNEQPDDMSGQRHG